MKMRPNTLGLLMAVIIFGGIMLSSLLGWWQTTSSLQPAKFSEGEFEGQPNPIDIRGSYGFADISTLFGIPLDTLAAAFMLPEAADPLTFANKDLEGLYGAFLPEGTEIGNSSVQLFVAYYTGLPFTISEEIYLPLKAVNILKAEADLSPEQSTYLDNHSLDIDPASIAAAYGSDGAEVIIVEEHDEDEAVVKGSTTFFDLLQWGVPETEIMRVIKADMPQTSILVRDYCTQNGLEFGLVKVELQLLVDAAQAN